MVIDESEEEVHEDRPHSLSEREEVRIKNAYTAFIRRNWPNELKPEGFDNVVKNLALELFDMYLVLTKKT